MLWWRGPNEFKGAMTLHAYVTYGDTDAGEYESGEKAHPRYIEYHTHGLMKCVACGVSIFSLGFCGENFCRLRSFYFFFAHAHDAVEAKREWAKDAHYFNDDWKFTKDKYIVNSICHRFITIKRKSDGNVELDAERMMTRLINRICLKKEMNCFAGFLGCVSLPGMAARKIFWF